MNTYIKGFSERIDLQGKQAWEWLADLNRYIETAIQRLDEGYTIQDSIAIHKTAVIEEHVILKSPIIIGPGVFIGAHSYLRNGVWLLDGVKIGPGCEIKSSIIFNNSALAHFNFVGDSLIGHRVNMEAGAVIANHYNEREDKAISVVHQSEIIATGCTKFGAVVGDDSRVGANAVLSPGTLLVPKSIVRRLELIEQIKP
ncbi:DapH/DapD/GlmU-related protein [Taibaiella sp. KBW10]|uniref:DapH/DapD/GlmU-related protein n=1 Tax=Taibaiella sp. KBW10 TaxID=2153357 RepID=UPI0018F62290|nr:DapH/DapD/GlmU-related protein [Taibaiella sp. KBW10]